MLTIFATILLAAPLPPGESDFTWNVRSRTDPKNGKAAEIKATTQDWFPKQTAIIVIDMWDDHHCKSAAARVAEMAPAMNETLKAARKLGVTIVHSPSACMKFYKDHPGRKRAQEAPKAAAPMKFQWNYFDEKREAGLPARLEKAGCSCDSPEPCSPPTPKWTRQHPLIEIEDDDVISDDGQEVFNVLKDKKIDSVVVMGVHTNVCVLGRPFGIRQMVKLKEAGLLKSVILCRDLTDSYHRDPGKHFEGLREIVAHIERHWCPTIESTSITNKDAFRFKGDKT